MEYGTKEIPSSFIQIPRVYVNFFMFRSVDRTDQQKYVTIIEKLIFV